jgi:hypothetical protein
MRTIHQQATAHSDWLDRLSDHYRMPRMALIRLLDRPGALEYEIARLISTAARSHAARLLSERERPDTDSPDMWDRAVAGHYRQLRDAQIAASAAQFEEVKTLVNQGYIEADDAG